jgi:hypothetical protein
MVYMRKIVDLTNKLVKFNGRVPARLSLAHQWV